MKDLEAALAARRSVRGFRPEPFDQEEVRRLFAMAQRAPSWCNIQPWRVWVTAPPVTGELAAALGEAARSGLPAPEIAFPGDYPEPYLAHRRACGFALYQSMGIAREDKASRYEAWLRNYALFDARRRSGACSAFRPSWWCCSGSPSAAPTRRSRPTSAAPRASRSPPT